MRQATLFTGISLLALIAGLVAPASAQMKDNYVGANIGQSKFDADCVGSGCDKKDTGLRIYGGGKFTDWLGLELSYFDFGKANLNPGDEKAQSVNASAVLGFPLGPNSSVFAKGGAAYTRANVTGGRKNGFEPSYGVGAAIGLTRNWQVRLDWDRVKFEIANGKDNVDMLSAGVQYRFN
jgi:OOP family OmpA-OmpF porin